MSKHQSLTEKEKSKIKFSNRLGTVSKIVLIAAGIHMILFLVFLMIPYFKATIFQDTYVTLIGNSCVLALIGLIVENWSYKTWKKIHLEASDRLTDTLRDYESHTE